MLNATRQFVRPTEHQRKKARLSVVAMRLLCGYDTVVVPATFRSVFLPAATAMDS